MKNILFVGRYYSPKVYELIKNSTKGKVGYSTHNYEIAALEGLAANENVMIKSITCPAVFSYPHNNNYIFTPAETFNIGRIPCYSIGLCNIVFINKIWAFITSTYQIVKFIYSFKGEEVNIICNLASSAGAVKLAQFISHKKVKITYLILDIPQMVSNMDKMNVVKSFFIKIMNTTSMKLASKSDFLILMTEQMMDFITKPIKHTVIEGWVRESLSDSAAINFKSCKNVILYTGTLRKIFGIMNLLDAFQQIEDNEVELWLCGSGDAEQEIKIRSQNDNRIKFYGLVSSEKARELQKQATILVNPRTSKGDYTKYSFPSKTLEYLLSGKPAIVYKLPGIPDEYYQYLFTPIEETVDALAEKIKDVFSMIPAQRNAIALSGREFVLKNKTPEIQMSKVYKMLFEND